LTFATPEGDMYLRLTLHPKTRQALMHQWNDALTLGDRRLAKRVEALLAVAAGESLEQASASLDLSEQSVRNYVKAFLLNGRDSLTYRSSPGRPAKLTKTQKKELSRLVTKGPEAAGYDCGCWTTGLIQDLIWAQFHVSYSVFYLAELLKQLGFSYQKGRFVSDHLPDVTPMQEEWVQQKWPKILRRAKRQKAWVLFGDEVSFAQWGSLGYTWAPRGQQPVVKTCGKRRAYKVFGLIEYFTGKLFYRGQTDKFTAASYQAFLRQVLRKAQGRPILLIQDGARYHTSAAMQDFFAQHADVLTVYDLPKYSPEFNPIEYLWRNIKRQATHLRYFPTFDRLVQKVNEKLRYFAQHPALVLGVMGKYRQANNSVTA
jgi:transposase